MEPYWDPNGHATPHTVKYESDTTVSGFGYLNEGGLNFSASAASAYSEDDADFGPGRRGKASRQDPLSHRIIEKRRRDRMNSCLADLSRLIPPQYQRKGRGRIEKTEIIEMSIRYMKQLQHQEYANKETMFKLGYEECLQQAANYLFAGHREICYQLVDHLKEYMKGECLKLPGGGGGGGGRTGSNGGLGGLGSVGGGGVGTHALDSVSASSGSPPSGGGGHHHSHPHHQLNGAFHPPLSQLRDMLTASDTEHSSDHHDDLSHDDHESQHESSSHPPMPMLMPEHLPVHGRMQRQQQQQQQQQQHQRQLQLQQQHMDAGAAADIEDDVKDLSLRRKINNGATFSLPNGIGSRVQQHQQQQQHPQAPLQPQHTQQSAASVITSVAASISAPMAHSNGGHPTMHSPPASSLSLDVATAPNFSHPLQRRLPNGGGDHHMYDHNSSHSHSPVLPGASVMSGSVSATVPLRPPASVGSNYTHPDDDDDDHHHDDHHDHHHLDHLHDEDDDTGDNHHHHSPPHSRHPHDDDADTEQSLPHSLTVANGSGSGGVRLRKLSHDTTATCAHDIADHHHANSYKFKNYIQQRFSQDTHAMHGGHHSHHHAMDADDTHERMSVMTDGGATVDSHKSADSPHSAGNGVGTDGEGVECKKPKMCMGFGEHNSSDEKPVVGGAAGDCKPEVSAFPMFKTLLQPATPPAFLAPAATASAAKMVPIFALHSHGRFYVPLTVEYGALRPFEGAIDLLVDREPVGVAPLHSININVNFGGAAGVSAAGASVLHGPRLVSSPALVVAANRTTTVAVAADGGPKSTVW